MTSTSLRTSRSRLRSGSKVKKPKIGLIGRNNDGLLGIYVGPTSYWYAEIPGGLLLSDLERKFKKSLNFSPMKALNFVKKNTRLVKRVRAAQLSLF